MHVFNERVAAPMRVLAAPVEVCPTWWLNAGANGVRPSAWLADVVRRLSIQAQVRQVQGEHPAGASAVPGRHVVELNRISSKSIV